MGPIGDDEVNLLPQRTSENSPPWCRNHPKLPFKANIFMGLLDGADSEVYGMEAVQNGTAGSSS